ncbi:hypothetical protein RRG08_056695, partial [Elysia crispata]
DGAAAYLHSSSSQESDNGHSSDTNAQLFCPAPSEVTSDGRQRSMVLANTPARKANFIERCKSWRNSPLITKELFYLITGASNLNILWFYHQCTGFS